MSSVGGAVTNWVRPKRQRSHASCGTFRAVTRLCRSLRYLPGKQRAALILREVLDFSAAEVARILESTPARWRMALSGTVTMPDEAGGHTIFVYAHSSVSGQ